MDAGGGPLAASTRLADSRRQLLLVLNDGVIRRVNFQFK